MTTSADTTTTTTATTTATDTATTTNTVNTTTDYISLADSDGTRSVAKLAEVAASDGYSGMTDKEIEKLIAYKTALAQQNAETAASVVARQAAQAATQAKLEESLANSQAVLNKILNATFTPKTVTGNEVS